MARKNSDKINVAVSKAEKANSIFAAAYAEVTQANDLLAQAVEEHEAEIASLQARISYANAHVAKNAKVADKLSEFV